MIATNVTSTIDLGADGRHVGDLQVRWSDNSVPLGVHPVPIISLRNGAGPVALLIAGTHGDEFEGPAAIMRVMSALRLDQIAGQVIAIPALNTPAVRAATRVSPLDGVNLNRAFPGDPMGSVTQQIAHYVETVLLAQADVAVDLHSGGQASVFAPCALPTRTANADLWARNHALAQAFGLPLIWVLGGFNDSRSLNSAAARAGVPMIAAELGGGGGADLAITDRAEAGLYRVLRQCGVLSGAQAEGPSARLVEITDGSHSLYAPGEGVFDRHVSAGQDVEAGQIAGVLHYVAEPRRASEVITFTHDGFVLAHTNRGYVRRGDMLMMVAQDTTQD